ncbi:urease cluster protein [Streptococcus vestibularis]|uniref:urease cluster protein n=1 Tax=Streptococcus vestibularis TaxID=1343 RepID=UPI002000A246|nr:urease cluster protein [Streptococcus vestibularis]
MTLFYKKTLNQELAEEVKREDQLYKRMILISIITALVLTVFVANQLSQVLPSFAQLWQQVFQTLASLLNFNINFENSGLFISRLVTNLPLALGLFSKLVAVYLANDKPLSQKQF